MQLRASQIHEVIGVLATLIAIEHWRVLNGRTSEDN